MYRLLLIMLAFLLISAGAASTSQRTVPAGEIIAKVQNNQSVEYYDVKIAGDLNLSSLSHAVVRREFLIINSTIEDASFDGVSFEATASFWNTAFLKSSLNKTAFLASANFRNASFYRSGFVGASFLRPVIFDGAMFLKNVSFEESQFQKDASFNSVRFSGSADFNGSSFGYYAYFSGSRFLDCAYFYGAKFLGPLDFSNAIFFSKANFFESGFNDAGFSNVVFGGPVQFGLARFSGLSSFSEAVFYGDASFVLSHFYSAVDFSGAHFMDKAVLGLAKFDDIASFRNVTFDDDINLKSAQISTMLLEKAIFNRSSRIILNDTDFKRLKAPWAEIKDFVVYDPGVFLALVDNYRGLGWHDDEDDCYYSYRRSSQAKKEVGWSKAIDVMAWLSCGYGVRPSYTVVWAIFTVFVFAVIFWKGDGIRRSAKPLQGSIEIDSVPERVIFRNALFFSTCIFLSQGPIDFLPVGRHRYYVIIEGILGWLLLALFLVTLGKIMIR